jgi:hypothetical protein
MSRTIYVIVETTVAVNGEVGAVASYTTKEKAKSKLSKLFNEAVEDMTIDEDSAELSNDATVIEDKDGVHYFIAEVELF